MKEYLISGKILQELLEKLGWKKLPNEEKTNKIYSLPAEHPWKPFQEANIWTQYIKI